MEEKMQQKLPMPALLVTARPDKKPKKRKSEAEKAATKQALDKAKGQTRVNIGARLRTVRRIRSNALVVEALTTKITKIYKNRKFTFASDSNKTKRYIVTFNLADAFIQRDVATFQSSYNTKRVTLA